MVKAEIKNFITEDTVGIGLPYLAKGKVSLSGRVTVTQDMLEKKYAYLSVSGVVGEAEVFFGESRLGKISNGERVAYDVKGFLSLGDAEVKINLNDGAALTKSPVLLSFNSAAIDSVHVAERHEGGAVTVDIKLHTLGNADGVKAIATLVSPTGQIYYGGITKGYGTIVVKDPLYWWPRGLGVQNLYRLTVNLYGESDIEDAKEIHLGLRAASVFRESGIELAFNGVSFVPMGALYTPPSVDTPVDVTCRELLSLARGGANAVFIASTVEYISPELVELCDREGLVIIRQTGELARVGYELDALSNHPSLAFLSIPESEEQDSVYAAARASAPDAAIIFGNECDGAIIETLPSLPLEKTLKALGDKRETNPLANKILSLGGETYRDVLVRVADEYLFPTGGAELGYLTRHLQAKEVKEKIARARLREKDSPLSFATYSELCDREGGPAPSVIDASGHRKLAYYSASRAFSQVFATARRTDTGVEITVVNYRRSELYGSLFCKIIDSSNHIVREYSEELTVPSLSDATVSVSFDEYISGRENSCYLEYGVSSHDARYSDTMLFVKPKDFLYESPNIKLKVEGAGNEFGITLSSDKYTAGIELSFLEADVELSNNGFDVTSSAPIKLSAKLVGDKFSAEELSSKIEIKCLNTIGIDN